jgi:hypothetical protein
MDLREIGWGVWIGFDCLRTGTGSGLLWVRWWTFGFWRHGVSYIHPEQPEFLSEICTSQFWSYVKDNIYVRSLP